MKTRLGKIGLLVLVLTVCLAGLGAGYGLWSKTLEVSGTVDTGTVDARWDLMGCFDFETTKDVGRTSGRIDPTNRRIAYFNIDNAYPGYVGDCQMEYKYTGSVPMRVEDINIALGPELTGCVITKNPRTGEVRVECNELSIRWVDGLCTQLHQGATVASSPRATVNQPAQYDTQYTFSVMVDLYQYNESTACPIR